MLIIKDFLFSPGVKFVCPWEDTDLTSYVLHSTKIFALVIISQLPVLVAAAWINDIGKSVCDWNVKEQPEIPFEMHVMQNMDVYET